MAVELVKSPFDICVNPWIMCNEGWCVKLGHEGVAWGLGNCLKYLKREWKGKERRENKDFRKGGGQAGSKGGCLEKGGGLESLTDHDTLNITNVRMIVRVRIWLFRMPYLENIRHLAISSLSYTIMPNQKQQLF